MLSGTCMELTLLQSDCTEMFGTARKGLLCFSGRKSCSLCSSLIHFGLTEQYLMPLPVCDSKGAPYGEWNPSPARNAG